MTWQGIEFALGTEVVVHGDFLEAGNVSKSTG